MDENLPAIAIDYLMNHQDFPADENYNPEYSDKTLLDLETVEPTLAGPKGLKIKFF